MNDEAIALIEALRAACSDYDDCDDCPAYKWCHDKSCPTLCEAAADLIESLAAELEQVKQERDGLNIMLGQAQSMLETRTCERDAAVEDLKGLCDICAHFKTCEGPWCGDCDAFDGCESPCKTCAYEGNWQWRGAREKA